MLTVVVVAVMVEIDNRIVKFDVGGIGGGLEKFNNDILEKRKKKRKKVNKMEKTSGLSIQIFDNIIVLT